jgi:hypothetical protein
MARASPVLSAGGVADLASFGLPGMRGVGPFDAVAAKLMGLPLQLTNKPAARLSRDPLEGIGEEFGEPWEDRPSIRRRPSVAAPEASPPPWRTGGLYESSDTARARAHAAGGGGSAAQGPIMDSWDPAYARAGAAARAGGRARGARTLQLSGDGVRVGGPAAALDALLGDPATGSGGSGGGGSGTAAWLLQIRAALHAATGVAQGSPALRAELQGDSGPSAAALALLVSQRSTGVPGGQAPRPRLLSTSEPHPAPVDFSQLGSAAVYNSDPVSAFREGGHAAPLRATASQSGGRTLALMSGLMGAQHAQHVQHVQHSQLVQMAAGGAAPPAALPGSQGDVRTLGLDDQDLQVGGERRYALYRALKHK